MQRFQKYEGLGNDFLVLEGGTSRATPDVTPRAVTLCDRRRGVGGDGILVVGPKEDGAVARMTVVNADGSIPEMCGNGLRCVALHLVRTGRASEAEPFVVSTDVGPRSCLVTEVTGTAAVVEVDMGSVVYLEDLAIEVHGLTRVFSVASAGNPHAILFGESSRHIAEWIGPEIEQHLFFPAGTNVEFAQKEREGIRLWVWERGVGITEACGTGACATVVAAVHRKYLPAGAPVPVFLPGGTLVVTYEPEKKRTRMRGPARFVFEGILPEGP